MNNGIKRELDLISSDREAFKASINNFKDSFAKSLKENGMEIEYVEPTFKDKARMFFYKIFNICK